MNVSVSLKYVEKYINAFGIKMSDYLEADNWRKSQKVGLIQKVKRFFAKFVK